MENNKKILIYLQNGNKTSESKISQDLSISLDEVKNSIKFLREKKLVSATHGWGNSAYTNIELKPKGIESLQKKELVSKKTIINVKENHGNISSGDNNEQHYDSSTKAKEETFLSKFLSWIISNVTKIVVGLAIAYFIYYFGLK